MTISAEICRLLERAKPLRRLTADEAEDAGLGKLVEQINALRKIEADAEREASLAQIKANLGAPDDVPEPEKRKPGRPKKAD
jgi:hypothetical protein